MKLAGKKNEEVVSNFLLGILPESNKFDLTYINDLKEKVEKLFFSLL